MTTTGVITADYSTGGFAGFYLQTAGTGGAADMRSHDMSDAVFVHGLDVAKAVHIGGHVQVTGPVWEYNGLTELFRADSEVTALADPAQPVQPLQVDQETAPARLA